MSLPADRTPVIIGIGEVVDRPTDPGLALEPLALMDAAIRAADGDAGGTWLARADSIDIINMVSWRYDTVAKRLNERLGINPARAVYGVVGGETPTARIHEAALRIINGNSVVAIVTAGEAAHAVGKAKTAGIQLPWTPASKTPENPVVTRDHVTPLAIGHGIVQPAHIYPLYENATTAAWGLTPAEALAESGAAYEKISQAAAANPYAWNPKAFTAEQIIAPAPENRIIAWPYTKRMVANNTVNMGAAVIMTTLALARAAGITDDKLVFVHGGAAAAEPMDYLQRDQYTHSVAQDAVLAQAMRVAEAGFDRVELYSCFPTVPKMARRTLGLAPDCAFSVTGGLSFFGTPLNGYMLHATCAMVRSLRAKPAQHALLYGQGGYVTKHHALVVGSAPGAAAALMLPKDVQDDAEAARADVPAFDAAYAGPATIETYSVIYDRDGVPAYGSVVGRTPQGARIFAKLDIADTDTLTPLLALDRSPIGNAGTVTIIEDSLQHWTS